MSNLFIPYIGMDKVVSQEVSASLSGYQSQLNELSAAVDQMTILSGYDDTRIKKLIKNEETNRIAIDNEISAKLINQINARISSDNSFITDIQNLSQTLSENISNVYTKLETNELLSEKVNVLDFNEYKEQISSELSSIVDNDTIYDDTQIKADITELSAKLENLVDNDTIYDDTQLRSLIATETDARILEDTNLSSQIEILKLEKGDDYTAFEVFPHNFIIQDTGAISNNTAKTVAEMFQPWQKVKSSGGIKFINVTNTDIGQLNNYYYIVQNNIKSYKRFHPVSGFIDITLEDVTELPQIGNINTLYKISNTEYYLYYDEAIRNLRKCLTTAKDDHVFFKLKLGYQLSIKLRTHLSQEQVDNGKSNIIIDWGDGEQTAFKNYTLKDSTNYIFNHIYAKQNWNKNLIVKIYGDDYYLLQFNERNYTTSTSMIIVSRMFDYDLPVAKCLTRFPNFCANNLVYSVDIRKCNKLFEGCNIGSMFTTPCIQQVKGFTDDANEFAFNSIYCMNYIFNGVGTLKTIDFKFPALCKLPLFQYIFNGVYFNYGGEPYDILNLFNNFSFNLMPKDEAIDVAGMFNNCKNITCSNIEKLGKILWNNPNLTWKNTSSVFSKVTADFLSGVPVEWGGTLTGWVPPVENTFDDTEIRNLISAETENRILEDNKLNTAITQLSSVISEGIVVDAYTRAETDELLSAKLDLNIFDEYKEQISSELNNKADSSTTYAKTQVNALLSAKLDTNIFDEYAEQISGELSALTVTDTNISEQVNVLDKKVNLLQAEKLNNYTAFEVFPHNFGINTKVQMLDENNNIITKSPKFSEVFGDWVEIGNNTIPNIEFDQLIHINQVIGHQIEGSTDRNYYRFNPFNQGDEQYVLLTSGIKEVTELPEVGDPYALYKLYDANGTLIMQYLYAIPEIKALRSCFTTAQDYYYISPNQSNINIQTSFSLGVRSSVSNVEDLDVYIDFGDGSGIYHISDPEIYLGKSGQFYSFSYEYKEVNKNYVVKIYGSKYFAIQFSRTPNATHNIVTNYLTPELPLAKHIKNFASMFNSQIIYKLNPPRYTYNFNSCNMSSDSFPGKLQSISAMDPAPVSIYNMSGMWKGKQYLQKFAFTIPAIIESGSTASMDSTFYNMSFLKPFDILGLFKSYSLIGMKGSTINVSNLFAKTQNITCSNYQKLGSFLWNNTNINWTNTSTAFTGCPEELRANIPEQWGGTLTGWTAPAKLTKEYVDNNITQLQETINSFTDNDTIYDDTEIRNEISGLQEAINSLTDNDTVYDDTEIRNEISGLQETINELQISGGIYNDTNIIQQISTVSARIQEISSIIKTDGFGNKFLADDGNYYQISFNESNGLNTDKLSTYLDENGYLQVVPAEFITETQLEQKNYVDQTSLTNTINTFDYINAQYLIDNEYLTIPELPNTAFIKTLVNRITKLQNTVIDLQNKLALTQLQLSEYKIEADEEIVYVTDYGPVSGYLPSDEQLSGYLPSDEQLSGIISGQF